MKKVLIALVVLFLLVVLAAGGAFVWLDHTTATAKAEGDASPVELTVPKGANGRSVGKLLVEKELIDGAFAWRWLLWRRGGLNAKAGRHSLKASMTMEEVAAALETSPMAEDEPFVMIEGWRLRDTDAALATAGWCKPGEYLKAASDPSRYKAAFPLPAKGTLEGYL